MGRGYSICVLLTLTGLSYNNHMIAARYAELNVLSNCTCPGYKIVYQCTVVGDGFTSWKGSAFDCRLSGNEVLLSHSDFVTGTKGTCNEGLIVGHSLNVINDCYTSQLDVYVVASLGGKSIECVYESGSGAATAVGSSVLSITKDPFPPPTNLRLMNVSHGVLLFEWNAVATNCSALYYHIDSDCGQCPSSSNLSIAFCSVLMLPTVCSFAVRSVVCGNIAGNWSDPIYTTLKVPESPVISSLVCTYGTDEQKNLIKLEIRFNTGDSFHISEGIDGSPSHYAVVYSNSFTGREVICGSALVSAQSCLIGVCTSSLPASCYPLYGDVIKISVSASNILGDASSSDTYTSTTNQYVDVTFDSARHVICEFIGEMYAQSQVSCSMSYGPCDRQSTMSIQGFSTSESPNTVELELLSNLETYCYTINASNNTFTVLLDGVYGNEVSYLEAVTLLSILTGIVTIITLILIFALLIVKRKKSSMQRFQIAYHVPSSESESDPRRPVLAKAISKYSQKPKINVHFILELKDEPWELLKALEIFKDRDINIMDIVFSEPTKSQRRKVYFECEHPLTEKKEVNINSQFNTVGISCEQMYIEGKPMEKKDISSDGATLRFCVGQYKYVRSVSKHPGTLYNLLSGIRDITQINTSYGLINITSIVIRPSEGFPDKVVVELNFVPVLPPDWIETFNDNTADFLVKS